MNSEFVAKTKDFVLEKARLAQEKISQGYNAAKLAFLNTSLGARIADTASKVANNVATFIGIGATTGQTTANVALATSQTTLATTGEYPPLVVVWQRVLD